MSTVKKLYINKNDEVTTVVERLIDTDADEVVLSIPKFSKVAETASNFHLLRREAEVLKKKIIVESVDEVVLKICGAQKIECLNPFFSKTTRRMTDIVSREERAEPMKRGKKNGHSKEEEEVSQEKEMKEHAPMVHGVSEAREPHAATKRRLPFGRRMKIGAVALLALLVVVVVGGMLLKKARIDIVRATAGWKYDESVTIDTGSATPDVVSRRIPGQLFSDTKNVTLSFPATGRKNMQRKAQGTIIIYNAFGSQPQALIARTRFVTPEGKVFRLVASVTIPGAKTVEGKLIPSSIEANVIAEEAGTTYNVGPVSRFTIPGFAGTPKANGFYAESKRAMAGGVIGDAAYPTEEDIKNAKELSKQTIENALRTLLVNQIPPDFTSLKNAEQLTITKQTVHPEVGEDNQFTVFIEGAISLMVFREADVRAFLLERMRTDVGKEFEVKSDTLVYREEEVRREGEKLVVPLTYESTVARAVDIVQLKTHITGKKESELRKVLFETPGLASARVSLWPFWVRRVPGPEKIEIAVE